MRGSEAEEDWTQWERKVSMKLIKSEGGRRVTPSFSGVVEGSRSGWREGASGPASWNTGMWIMVRSKSARSRSQQAWWWFNAWGLWK